MRELLLDRGLVFAKSITRTRCEIRTLLEEGASELSDIFRSVLAQLHVCFLTLDHQIAWFDADPARKQIDIATNERWDKLIAAYERATARAREEFGAG